MGEYFFQNELAKYCRNRKIINGEPRCNIWKETDVSTGRDNNWKKHYPCSAKRCPRDGKVIDYPKRF